MWINPEKFLEVTEKNLPLFQYIIGPKLTPSLMLKHLADPSQDVITDYTLLGILLGFGTQNTLPHHRVEVIRAELYRKENLPLKSKQERLDTLNPFLSFTFEWEANSNKTFPSFGYASLAEEYKDLTKTKFCSRKSSDQSYPEIPMFAVFKEDSETLNILSSYKKDKLRIKELLSQPNFLEQTLNLIFE